MTIEDLLQVASGWLSYSPLEAWKLSPREITAAFKGWEAKTKYLVSIERNLMIGQALKIVAPHVKKGSDIARAGDQLMRLPWEKEEVKKLTEEEKAILNKRFPKQLPDISKWQLVT